MKNGKRSKIFKVSFAAFFSIYLSIFNLSITMASANDATHKVKPSQIYYDKGDTKAIFIDNRTGKAMNNLFPWFLTAENQLNSLDAAGTTDPDQLYLYYEKAWWYFYALKFFAWSNESDGNKMVGVWNRRDQVTTEPQVVGSKCDSLGSVFRYKGKYFTCIESNTGNVLDSGVDVASYSKALVGLPNENDLGTELFDGYTKGTEAVWNRSCDLSTYAVLPDKTFLGLKMYCAPIKKMYAGHDAFSIDVVDSKTKLTYCFIDKRFIKNKDKNYVPDKPINLVLVNSSCGKFLGLPGYKS